MNQKEHNVIRAKLDVDSAEAKVQQARKELEHGFKRLSADVDKAKLDVIKAEHSRDEGVSKLELAVKEAEFELERERNYHKLTEDEAAKGFES